MLANSEIAYKSGSMGTPMLSRPGKFTSYQHLCFNKVEEHEEAND